MKYFENLPKKTFTSTIGNFVVSDFFTYSDTNNTTIETSNITIDSHSTLLEAAFNVYQDANSFWMFLLANKTINPFTLLSVNPNIFLQQNQDKLNTELVGNTAGTTGYVFPQGGILVPYKQNSGGSYSYSSVGNFDLSGPLTIIESVSYYNGQMIIKDQKGSTYPFIQTTGSTGEKLLVIYPDNLGGYTISNIVYPYNVISATQTIVKTQFGIPELIEEGPMGGAYLEQSVSSAVTGSQEITILQTVQSSSKEITAYTPSATGVLKSSFVTTKYN